MNTANVDLRRDVVDRIRRELLGPANGERELVIGRPSFRYITGMLFPPEDPGTEPSELQAEEHESEETSGSGDPDEVPDAAVASAYDLLPSSMGISFYVQGAQELVVDASAARYVRRSLGSLIQEYVEGGCSQEDLAIALEGLDLDVRTVRRVVKEEDLDEGLVRPLQESLGLEYLVARGVRYSLSELGSMVREFVGEGRTDEKLRRTLKGLNLDESDVREILKEEALGEDVLNTLVESIGSGSKRSPKRIHWQRIPIPNEAIQVRIPNHGRHGENDTQTLGGAAVVITRFRAFGDGHLVTVTLLNAAAPQASMKADETVEHMLFQVTFGIRVESGSIGAYPDTKRLSLHNEDEELSLVYRDRRTFGIGHGCAAVWDPGPSSGTIDRIRAEPLPGHVVRGLTNDIALDDPLAERALDIAWLASEERTPAELADTLGRFVDGYERWVVEQDKSARELDDTAPAPRLVERQRRAVERMRRGVSALTEGNEPAFRAFRLAQRAMALQFAWSKNRTGGPFDLGDGRVGPIAEVGLNAKWFPFQLGFQLLVLESLLNHDSLDREVVDLLWFPTGGGKTEAYLALAAFEMLHRRLRYQDGGPAVLMRYTLRLLTAQQFERCATLIGALESMRRKDATLGEESFRLGLWVGGGLTPNRLTSDSSTDPGAMQLVEELLEAQEPDNPFQLRQCPRCGTRIVPRRKARERAAYGVHADASEFRMNCPDAGCELHDEIPTSVIDEDLFRRPPTFLVGTIDKFARMAWDARSRALLGVRGGGLPASLVIQDELHLITGPLGSIAGGYEAAIETVLRCAGLTPKYIASTATIQRAAEQCRSLYARPPFVFPPSGLQVDDSYFSREDPDAPGRLYVGIMGNGLYSSLTTLVQTSAAAAQAAMEVPVEDTVGRDSYWTQVIYHNSKQELGKTTTMLRDDVRTRLELLESRVEDRRVFENVEELSANLKGSMVSEAIERLEVGWTQRNADEVIDAVACTNMISVGVDIGRLGIMLVKGQPKSTAEYIQATSRVGRDWRRRPPGIVLTMYGQTRPRDRSHYESFQAYHQALYRFVEPSSVTPFSPRARDRTLHAALVLAMRQRIGWIEEERAMEFDPDATDQREVLEVLKERIQSSCRQDDVDDVLAELDRRVEDWLEQSRSDQMPVLRFSGGRQFRTLLKQFDDGTHPGLWQTLNSMRHVDGETPFVVLGEGAGRDAQ